MNWHHIWVDSSTNRVRCGWRVLTYLLLASAFTILPAYLLYATFFSSPAKSTSLITPMVIIEEITTIIAFIVLGIWALRVLEHLPAQTLGLSMRGPWSQALGGGFSIGLGFTTLLLLVLWVTGCARFTWNHPNQQMIGQLCLLLLFLSIEAMAEEVVFRGYLFQTLLRGIGPLAALCLTSACFALFHLPHPHITVLAVVNLFLAGMMFGMLYLRLGTLWLPIGVHAGWNFGKLLFNLPLSGHTFPLTTPMTGMLAAKQWMTGGAFGLEGGLGVSVLLLCAIAVITYSRRGLPLESRWWEWRDLVKTTAPSSGRGG